MQFCKSYGPPKLATRPRKSRECMEPPARAASCTGPCDRRDSSLGESGGVWDQSKVDQNPRAPAVAPQSWPISYRNWLFGGMLQKSLYRDIRGALTWDLSDESSSAVQSGHPVSNLTPNRALWLQIWGFESRQVSFWTNLDHMDWFGLGLCGQP